MQDRTSADSRDEPEGIQGCNKQKQGERGVRKLAGEMTGIENVINRSCINLHMKGRNKQRNNRRNGRDV